MEHDLLFAEGLAGPDLVFGRTGNPPIIQRLGSAFVPPAPTLDGPLVAGAVPLGLAAGAGLPLALAIARVPALSSAATLPAPAPAFALSYDNAVNRAPFRWADHAWQQAPARGQQSRIGHRAPRAGQVEVSAIARRALRRGERVESAWQPQQRDRRPPVQVVWTEGQPRATAVREGFQPLSRAVRPAIEAPFTAASQRPRQTAFDWIELFRRARPTLSAPWEEGVPRVILLDLSAGSGSPNRLLVSHPWQIGRAPAAGRSPLPPGPEPDPDPYIGSPHLVFPWLGKGGRVIIPVRRTYLVLNEVTLTRVSNTLSLPALSLSLSIDSSSWVWGWSASLPASSLGDLLPAGPGEPVEVEAVVNGVNFRLLAEKITRDRRFAQARITVSGRGLAAELGAPYAPVISRHNEADRTAQQLMGDALTFNAVSLGWDLDWHLTDWLVPAGVWSHTGAAIDACARIAAAAGGYVQASRHSKTLSILPRYPVAPWDWSGVVPDFSLPSAATTRESVRWLEKPAYNSVYLSGEAQGILAHVTRAGTAGDLLAPMIVDALITHSEAARQRGISVLSDTGPQQLLVLETPVFPGVGIYPVGAFVAFSDGTDSRRGLVRSVSLNATFPTVRQTVEIECHE